MFHFCCPGTRSGLTHKHTVNKPRGSGHKHIVKHIGQYQPSFAILHWPQVGSLSADHYTAAALMHRITISRSLSADHYTAAALMHRITISRSLSADHYTAAALMHRITISRTSPLLCRSQPGGDAKSRDLAIPKRTRPQNRLATSSTSSFVYQYVLKARRERLSSEQRLNIWNVLDSRRVITVPGIAPRQQPSIRLDQSRPSPSPETAS
jgi:hypothetical protein